MKRLIILLLFSTLLISGTNAQFSFGVKGGLTVSSMNIDMIPDTAADAIFGYNAGVFFKFGSGLLTFQPEVMFVRRGTQLNDKSSDWYQQYNMNYIDVPLLLRIGVDLKVAELYFLLGPYVGYLASAKIKDRTFNEETNQWVENDYKYDFDNNKIESRWDAGAVMGVGARLLMVIFEVRYNTGLVNVGDNSVYNSSKHKYLNVSLGVQF